MSHKESRFECVLISDLNGTCIALTTSAGFVGGGDDGEEESLHSILLFSRLSNSVNKSHPCFPLRDVYLDSHV